METKYTRQMFQTFDLLPKHLYLGDTNTNKNVGAIGVARTLTECGFSKYRQARVEKLRELYERHRPEIKKTWVLPKGETDGRKSIIVEEIIGEDVSPFDLPDFEDQMPSWKDYVDKYGE